jgi:hypothetical protein
MLRPLVASLGWLRKLGMERKGWRKVLMRFIQDMNRLRKARVFNMSIVLSSRVYYLL